MSSSDWAEMCSSTLQKKKIKKQDICLLQDNLSNQYLSHRALLSDRRSLLKVTGSWRVTQNSWVSNSDAADACC